MKNKYFKQPRHYKKLLIDVSDLTKKKNIVQKASQMGLL